jgi:ABC-2 type transport system ATP-binding protein
MSIEAQNITKYYGSQLVLDDINFSIPKGQIVGFLGPNGAGKSTMMRILTTYLRPTEGVARISGMDVEKNSRKVQQCIGYLPEQNPLYPDMYVKEYLKFSAEVYGNISPKRIEQVIEETGLSSHTTKKIKQLSKGYRQRVGLANALLHQPEVLILDEPTTGLDPNQLVDIRSLIRRVGKTSTVLLSTHIMQEVEAVCDRVIIIANGKIVADDLLKNLAGDDRQVLDVEFDYRVETIALERLRDAVLVEQLDGFAYRITFDTQQDRRSTVFDYAHDNQLKILSMQKRTRTLEKMFQELTGK